MNKIEKVKSSFLSIMLILLLLNACQTSFITPFQDHLSTSPSAQELATKQPILTITPSQIFDQTGGQLTGPWLLIKDDTNPNQLLSLLDISSQKIEPISLPPNLTVTNLSRSISPDSSNLVLTRIPSATLISQTLYIFNYFQEEIEVEIPLSPSEPLDFTKIYDALQDEMKNILTDRNYGVWMLSESAANSIKSFQWGNNGNSVYHSKLDLDGFTYLFQYDLISGKDSKLESEPYFLEAVKFSPDKSSLLVIKSLLTQIPDFPLKSVFVITETGELIRLPFQEQKPGVIVDFSWFDSENILVSSFDTMEFSYTSLRYFQLRDQQFHEMTTSQFDKFIQLNKHVILFRTDNSKEKSQLDIFSLDGLDHSFVINDKCIHVDPSPLPCCQLIVSCEQNSYSLDDNFSIEQLPDIQGRLFFSPDNQFVINDQTNSSNGQQSHLSLLNADFSLIREFSVDSTRQVIWQPDSQGFLFLTLDGLYHVSLPNGEPTRVYDSNTDDYRHIDVFWIFR